MHHGIFSEEFFGEFYEYYLCPCNIYTSVSEDGSFSEYSSDSDNMNIKPIKSQKKKKHTLVIDSDTESENETCSTGEDFTRFYRCVGCNY